MARKKWDPQPKPDRWEDIPKHLNAWAKELEKWGKRVRRDILKLEQQLDHVVKNCCDSAPGVSEELEEIAKDVHNRITPDEPYEQDDPEDPPPPPWEDEG